MKRIFLIMTALLMSGCDSGPGACIYTTANDTHSCFQNTSGSKSDFHDACKKVLILNKLKYKDMTMDTGEACPISPTATCRNVLDNMANLNFYNLASKEEIELQGRVCKKSKGSFVVH